MATLKAIPNLTQSQPPFELEDEQGQSTVLACRRRLLGLQSGNRQPRVRRASRSRRGGCLEVHDAPFRDDKFEPHGVTAFALLSGSHLSVHSWPEHRYLAADIYVCAEGTDPAAAVELLRSRFEPDRVDCRRLSRGVLSREMPM